MRKYLWVLIIFCFFFFLYSFGVLESFRAPAIYNWDSDFGRDLYFMQKIARGDFVLTGPQLSFGGLRMSAYYFYLFSPFLYLFGWKGVFFANAFFFAGALGFLAFVFQKKFGFLQSVVSSFLIGLSPYFVFSARTPGNAMSYLPFLMLLLIIFLTQRSLRRFKAFIFGFLFGVVVNFHPVVLPGFVLFVALFKRPRFIKILLFTAGFLLSFFPVFLFELRHKFVIAKSFFASSEEFVGEGVFVGVNPGKFFSTLLYSQNFSVGGLGFLILGGLLLLFLYKSKVEKNIIFVVLAVLFLFLSFGRVVYHYFFPYILSAQIIFLFLFFKILEKLKSKNKSLVKFLIYSFFTVLIFFSSLKSRIYYTPVKRNFLVVEKKFLEFLKNYPDLPKSLNVFLVGQTPLASLGWEYRYLLEREGFEVESEFSYPESRYLLVVSEKGEIDFDKLSNFEFTSWRGDSKMYNLVKFKNNGFIYYLLEKK